jgi:hypothetical protein
MTWQGREQALFHFGDSTGHVVRFSTSHLDRLQQIAEGKIQP